MPSSIRVKCHRCGYEWTYMGNLVEMVYRDPAPKRPVRIGCRHCRAAIRLDKIVKSPHEPDTMNDAGRSHS